MVVDSRSRRDHHRAGRPIAMLACRAAVGGAIGRGTVSQVGQQEIDAIARVIRSNALFRYGVGDECDRFETRYADYLGVKHFALAASGSNALAAAMTPVGLGPGHEGILPSPTYMGTAT